MPILNDIFELLFTTKIFGVGLGMTVVKQVLEQHNGGAKINSDVDLGTRVTLWLPTSQVEKVALNNKAWNIYSRR